MSLIMRNGTKANGQHLRYARASANPDDPPVSTERRTRRGMSTALLKRVAVLPPRDRAIVELTLSAKLSRAHIGRAFGLAGGQVSRRLRVLYARLHDPLVIALFEDGCPLAAEYRQLGIEHFLLAQPAQHLADKHRMSSTEVRRILTFIRGWHKGLSAASRR